MKQIKTKPKIKNEQTDLNYGYQYETRTKNARKACSFKAGNCLFCIHERIIELQEIKKIAKEPGKFNH